MINFSSFIGVRIAKSVVVVVKHDDSNNKKKEAASDLKRRGN